MTGERLLASYIVRVMVQKGQLRISVLDVTQGETQLFSSYPDLIRFMAARGSQTTPVKGPERPEGS